MKEEGKRPGFGSLTAIFTLAIILLLLSLYLAYKSMVAYAAGESALGLPYFVFSLTGLALSAYFIMHLKGVRMVASRKGPSFFTMAECLKCGFKSIRLFQKGDYVLKDSEGCPKCSQKMLITSIYMETEQKP